MGTGGAELLNKGADGRLRRTGGFDDESRVLGFLTSAEMPIHDYMAREFCVLDRWFCSFPGGTYPNRMFQLAGLRLH